MQKQTQRPHFEFVVMMAALMSIVALAIDALLPAIPDIGLSIQSLDPTDNQLLVTMIFLGLGAGQLLLGPISDSLGRKPVVYIGFSIFLLASFICLYAPSLEIMVLGRIFQGIGLAAPRTIAISMIRDSYRGDRMAKTMSFVTAFFILVPIIAPALGKLILDQSGWQAIFYVQMVMALIIGFWFWNRQPETLRPEHKIPFNGRNFIKGAKEFFRHRDTVVFTLNSGLLNGAFLVYLSSAQHIFVDQYGLEENFPFIFAGLAFSIGLSTFLNGTLVMRFGMRRLSLTASVVFCLVALLYAIWFKDAPNPGIFVLLGFLSVLFLCLGFVWGNFRSMAMEPIGHIAGIGAAINGFVSTMISIPIATFIGSFVVDSVWPLFMGLALCGLCSLAAFLLLGSPRGRRLSTVQSPWGR